MAEQPQQPADLQSTLAAILASIQSVCEENNKNIQLIQDSNNKNM